MKEIPVILLQEGGFQVPLSCLEISRTIILKI